MSMQGDETAYYTISLGSSTTTFRSRSSRTGSPPRLAIACPTSSGRATARPGGVYEVARLSLGPGDLRTESRPVGRGRVRGGASW